MENIEYIKLNINFNEKKRTVRIYYYLAKDIFLKILKYKDLQIFKLTKAEKKVIIDYVEKLIFSLKDVYYFHDTKNFNFLLNKVIYQDIIRHIENDFYNDLIGKNDWPL